MTSGSANTACIQALRWVLVAVLLAGCAPDQSLPGMRWRFDAGFAGPGQSHSGRAPFAPIFSDGTLYVVTGERLHALDVQTGSKKWSFGPVRNVPPFLAAGDRLVVLSPTSGSRTQGVRFQAVDAPSGNEQWTSQVLPSFSHHLVGDGVIVGIGDAGEGFAPHYFGIDVESGKTLWRLGGEVLSEGQGGEIEATPVMEDGIVYSAEMGGKIELIHFVYDIYLKAIDAKTGNVVDVLNLSDAFDEVGGVVGLLPEGDFLYVMTNEKGILRISRESLRGQRFADAGNVIFSQIAGGVLYTLSGIALRAFDLATGDKRWSFEPKAGGITVDLRSTSQSLILATGTFEGDDVAYGLDPLTGGGKSGKSI